MLELNSDDEPRFTFDPCILLVDDARDNLRVLEHALSRAGFTRLHATQDPRDVVPLFQRLAPDLVVLDLHMPHIDGLSLLGQLRPLIQGAGWVPVIVITSDQTVEARRQALSLGATDFLIKPFERVEMVQRIRNALEARCLYLRLQAQNALLEERVRERTQSLEAVQARFLQAEQEKQQFYKDVIRAVTHDRLNLVDVDELPDIGAVQCEISLDEPANYSLARRELRRVAVEFGMAADMAEDLVLAAGEAITNAIKHGTDGRCCLSVNRDLLIVRVSDHGGGIHARDLPASVLSAGFSTKASLGVGYTLMLQLSDRLWLATSDEGTIVQIEKRLQPVQESADALLAAWNLDLAADEAWEHA